MSDKQKEAFRKVTCQVLASRVELRNAYDMIAEAAESCKGTPLEDRLNSFCDDIDNMIFDLKQEWKQYKERLEQEAV